MEHMIDDFDDFIEWLLLDGLKVKTSKRLWKKKIYTNLINEHKRTVENYKDFLEDKKVKSLIGSISKFKNANSIILKVNLNNGNYILNLDNGNTLKIKYEELDNYIENQLQREVIENC